MVSVRYVAPVYYCTWLQWYLFAMVPVCSGTCLLWYLVALVPVRCGTCLLQCIDADRRLQLLLFVMPCIVGRLLQW
jgi:hypothetical protein